MTTPTPTIQKRIAAAETCEHHMRDEEQCEKNASTAPPHEKPVAPEKVAKPKKAEKVKEPPPVGDFPELCLIPVSNGGTPSAELRPEEWDKRARLCRKRAREVFEQLVQRFVEHKHSFLDARMVKKLRKLKMVFDHSTRRLSTCHYADAAVEGSRTYIGLSATLVDNGAGVGDLIDGILHDLCHVVMGKEVGHKKEFKDFNVHMGGDGRGTCCKELSGKGLLRPQFLLYCANVGDKLNSGHAYSERMARPARAVLEGMACHTCKRNGKKRANIRCVPIGV